MRLFHEQSQVDVLPGRAGDNNDIKLAFLRGGIQSLGHTHQGLSSQGVHLTAQKLRFGVLRRDEGDHHVGRGRCSTVVVGVGLEDHLLTLDPLGQVVRAEAPRLLGDLRQGRPLCSGDVSQHTAVGQLAVRRADIVIRHREVQRVLISRQLQSG